MERLLIKFLNLEEIVTSLSVRKIKHNIKFYYLSDITQRERSKMSTRDPRQNDKIESDVRNYEHTHIQEHGQKPFKE